MTRSKRFDRRAGISQAILEKAVTLAQKDDALLLWPVEYL